MGSLTPPGSDFQDRKESKASLQNLHNKHQNANVGDQLALYRLSCLSNDLNA